MKDASQRIVITGMGTVNPLGHTVDEYWSHLKLGHSGVDIATAFDTSLVKTKIAGQIKNPSLLETRVSKQALRKMDLFSRYACFAAQEAIQQAQLEIGTKIDPYRIACVIGSGVGGFPTMQSSYEKFLFEKRIPPLAIPLLISNMAPANVSMLNQIKGPVYSIATACSSGSDSIISSIPLLLSKQCDVVLSGGTEASLTAFCIGCFNVLKALSENNAHPQQASRPFDKLRDGFVMSEGCGLLVLETLEHALKRKVKIYGEIVGYGSQSDAYHLTAPDPDTSSIRTSMACALKMADIPKEKIAYVNAHGTSTPLNDTIESSAIKMFFGEHAYQLKVSSIKGHLGHTIGAAGAIEAITCIKALEEQLLPSTLNLDNPDVENGCDLDYIPQKTALPHPVEYIMSNSLGFGGHNSVIIFKKYQP